MKYIGLLSSAASGKLGGYISQYTFVKEYIP